MTAVTLQLLAKPPSKIWVLSDVATCDQGLMPVIVRLTGNEPIIIDGALPLFSCV